MPSGFMPKGTVVNHWNAGSFASQKIDPALNISTLPCAAASKQSKAGMIWPAGNTSIRNRPPLISSTAVASRRAAPNWMSSALGKAVGIRHWTFGCAMTLGASTMAASATVATTPLAFAMNLRRSIIAFSSPSSRWTLRRQDAIPQSLLDHLIRPRQQRGRDGEAEGLGGLEVDHEFKLGRLLHRQITGFGPLQDPVHVESGAAEHVRSVRSVDH